MQEQRQVYEMLGKVNIYLDTTNDPKVIELVIKL
jgi:hypothetical protein